MKDRILLSGFGHIYVFVYFVSSMPDLEIMVCLVLAVWLSGDVVGHINEVTLRRARLVLRWVTFTGILSWYLTKSLRPAQPGHPSVSRQNEY